MFFQPHENDNFNDDFERMTLEMEYNRMIDNKPKSYSSIGKNTGQVRFDELRNRFIELFSEEKLNIYTSKWIKEVIGVSMASSVYEFPAVVDFFEAYDQKVDSTVVERAIKIGNSKK